MNLSIARNVWRFVALSIIPLSAFAQTSSAPNLKSGRQFVQEFYDWYAPVALRESAVPSSDVALHVRRSAFAPKLFRKLKEDSEAQSSCNEIVGIDFDPFLYSQDPAQHYEVAEISQNGRVFRAEISGVQFGERSKKPDVIAEFIEENGRWTFTNFHYPDTGTDLLAILGTPRSKCTVPRSPGKPHN